MSSIKSIDDLASSLGIAPEKWIAYGTDKAKVRLDAGRGEDRSGRVVLVSAITPTKAGEGKTTTAIGLAQGLAHLGERVCLALREPSLGPVFGIKGGAVGAGRSSLVPGADINLHFTGDLHAISAANNLLAAMLDNHLHHGNRLELDVRRILWRRVLDMNDRALRQIVVGLGGRAQGVPRESGFDITAASEVMAILCLARDAQDLRERLARIVVGLNGDAEGVTAGQLDAVGAMMVLLKDAMLPNLVQTGEGVPALIHGGPFANIAHGCNSVIATTMARRLADWTITEAGFGFDLGGEKFFDIKCASSGINPCAIVLVATIAALKLHGEARDLQKCDPEAVERGLPNLERHLTNARQFGKPIIIALNHHVGRDDPAEIEVVRRAAASLGVPFAVCEGVARGGKGGVELAEQLVTHAQTQPSPAKTLYGPEDSPREKMELIARAMYGAEGVLWDQNASRQLNQLQRMGLDHLPLCVAKTPASLSDDPKRVGCPTGFKVTVREVVLSAGAGFLVPILGRIMRMPGLPREPQAAAMDLVDGQTMGMR